MVHYFKGKKMSEKNTKNEALIRIGNLLEQKRKALGPRYKSREQFIYNRSEELFGSKDWISLRHLYNIEHGKNWVSIEKLIMLADALEEDPGELFNEIVTIYRNARD